MGSNPRLLLRRAVRSGPCFLAAAIALMAFNGPMPYAQQVAPRGIGKANETISLSLQRQVAALMQEKLSRTPAQNKLDSHLVFAIKIDRNDPVMQQVPKLKSSVKYTPTGRVEVDIKAQVTDLLLQSIRQLGGDIISTVPRFLTFRLTPDDAKRLGGAELVAFCSPVA